MSFLLAFFGVSPAAATRFLVLLVGTAVAVVAAGAAGFGAGWKANGWRLGVKVASLETRLVAAVDQGKVLAVAVNACNAGVQAAADVGAQVQAALPGLLEAARKAHKTGLATADKLDQALAAGTPKGAGCDDGWAVVERNRMAGAPR